MSSIQYSVFGGSEEIQDPDSIARQYLKSTRGLGTPKITSVSGGRTSAYMAINYPTDYYIFALVKTNDPGHIPNDPGLVREIRKKCPGFVGSLELPDTLRCVLELEQKIGKQITWVSSKYTFEGLISKKGGYLPNRFTRFCTEFLKYIPIFDWVTETLPLHFLEKTQHLRRSGHYQNPLDLPLIVEMNLGFRADEQNRVLRMVGGKKIKGGWDFSGLGKCEDHPRSRKKIEWRFRQAPLYLDGVKKHHIHSDPWIRSMPFPEISNCTHCPFKTPKEHREQHRKNPQCAPFWINLEKETGNTFLKDATLQEILDGKPTPLLEEVMLCGCTD